MVLNIINTDYTEYINSLKIKKQNPLGYSYFWAGL